MRPATCSLSWLMTLTRTVAEAPGERRKRMRAKCTGSFIEERGSSTVAAPAEKALQRTVEQHRVQRVIRDTERGGLAERDAAGGFPAVGGGELADGAKFFAVLETEPDMYW